MGTTGVKDSSRKKKENKESEGSGCERTEGDIVGNGGGSGGGHGEGNQSMPCLSQLLNRQFHRTNHTCGGATPHTTKEKEKRHKSVQAKYKYKGTA